MDDQSLKAVQEFVVAANRGDIVILTNGAPV
jgi:hypothetical protein